MKKSIALLILTALVFININQVGAAMKDTDVIFSEVRQFVDADGKVEVKLDWLRRPGEMALTVTYYGYLIQEGMVNFYINVNGETREFLTMKKELHNRAQQIKIISFHPTTNDNGVNRLTKLRKDTVVDSLLFKNAPYYSCFGDVNISFIFFANGRWDGDGTKNNENYNFIVKSKIEGEAFHF
jgi:hypothetical protein